MVSTSIKKINHEGPLLEKPTIIGFICTSLIFIFLVIPENFFLQFLEINNQSHQPKLSLINAITDGLVTVVFAFLQIGVIAHGFLRKYNFGKALVFTILITFGFMVPELIFYLSIEGVFLFIIYSKFKSYWLIFYYNCLVYIFEMSKWLFNKSNYSINNQDFITKHIFQDLKSYNFCLVISIIGLIITLSFILKTKSNYIWQKQPEYEPLNF